MINPQIATYIKEERAKGVVDADIKKALLEKDWEQGDIDSAFKAQRAIDHVGGLLRGRLDKGNFLKVILIGIVLQFLVSGLFVGGMMTGMVSGYGMLGGGIVGFFVMAILSLVIGVYEIGATVRRLHDIGQTGWYALGLVLISFIPVIGLLVEVAALIYLSITPGDVAENTYGGVPNPNVTLWQAVTGTK